MALLAQAAQGDAPAVEGNAALVRLPGLAAVGTLPALAGFLVWLKHNRFGWIWLLRLVCVTVHLNLLLHARESWVETKTASRMDRLAEGKTICGAGLIPSCLDYLVFSEISFRWFGEWGMLVD